MEKEGDDCLPGGGKGGAEHSYVEVLTPGHQNVTVGRDRAF